MAMTLIQVQTLHADALEKYHQLVSGTMPRVVVDQSGQRVEYTASNRAALYTYIQQLGALLPGASPVGMDNGPARFFF